MRVNVKGSAVVCVCVSVCVSGCVCVCVCVLRQREPDTCTLKAPALIDCSASPTAPITSPAGRRRQEATLSQPLQASMQDPVCVGECVCVHKTPCMCGAHTHTHTHKLTHTDMAWSWCGFGGHLTSECNQ